MPGLVGIVQKDAKSPLDLGLFHRMVTTLHHRSWYGVDTHVEPKVAIARIHLNIINPARQPYVSESGRVKVFLHGEIYNDESSASNHLEYIARTYERFGFNFAARLNGSFAILLLDEAIDVVMIATDRTASKPVFYYEDDAWLYFAPEPKALMVVPSLSKRLNLAAVASFLACGHYLNGQALLEGIRPLDNATTLIAKATGATTQKYWQYTFNESGRDRGVAYYQMALSDLIRQAVRRRIRSQHRYGILLSGGYDSRGILGCYLAERPQEPVTTISWGVAEDIPQSDCVVAKRLAGNLGLPHTFYPLHITQLPQHLHDFVSLHDGLTDACYNYPESLKIFSDIRTELGVQVILRGDESFGFSRPACDERTIFEKFSIVPLERIQHYKKILKHNWLSTFSELIQQTAHDLYVKSNTQDIYLCQNFVYLDQRIKHYINHLNYIKSLELEVRTPYLDNDILDFMCELPSTYHFGKRFYHKLMLKMFPDLLKEMATRTNVPNLDVVLRSTGLEDIIYRVNLAGDGLLKEYFDFDSIRKLHDEYFRGMKGKNGSRSFVRRAGKFLQRWPSIYRPAYKMYLPIQDRQRSDLIELPRIFLRILTLNLYWELLS